MSDAKQLKSFNEYIVLVDDYFKSLNQIELIGHVLIGLGVILIILGFIFM
ncbi:MAG: hypothetical protein ACLFN8_00390 [Candidatus Woesearchaeota archaeon]